MWVLIMSWLHFGQTLCLVPALEWFTQFWVSFDDCSRYLVMHILWWTSLMGGSSTICYDLHALQYLWMRNHAIWSPVHRASNKWCKYETEQMGPLDQWLKFVQIHVFSHPHMLGILWGMMKLCRKGIHECSTMWFFSYY